LICGVSDYVDQVSAIPLFVVFHGGREVARHAGAMPAPEICKFIENALQPVGRAKNIWDFGPTIY
jgi:thioredoxin-like negative regulator of GroEL